MHHRLWPIITDPAKREVELHTAPFIHRLTLAWGLLFIGLVAFSIFSCDGHLVFTLDDPYIHLAVARNILRGTYGINLGEPSSPCSSILWPWMLAVTEALGLGTWGALLLTALGALGTVLAMARLLLRLGLVEPAGSLGSYALGFALILTGNVFALPMTGMEHAWHVFTVLLAVEGLVAVAQGDAVRWPLWASLVLMPLMRFEGFAFSGAALVALWFHGERRMAARAVLILTLACAVWAVFMSHWGLPLVPGSMLIKSRTLAMGFQGESPWQTVVANLRSIPNNNRARLLAGCLAAILATCVFWRKKSGSLLVLLPSAAALLAHLLAGAYGWFERYEVYCVALALAAMCFVASQLAAHLRCILARHSGEAARMVLALVVLYLFASPYLVATWHTPKAARDIYEQQYQMARFLAEYYPNPVAVNDLGLVSYGNSHYVLDLLGLGSEETRRLILKRALDQEAIRRLAEEHGVHLALLYEKCFTGRIPDSWRRLAVLHNTTHMVSGDSRVSFYATPGADMDGLIFSLRRFRKSLPIGSNLTIEGEP